MNNDRIEWLGSYPSDWQVIKNKAIFKNVSIKNHGDDVVLSLYRDYGVIPKDSREDNHNVTSLDTDSYKYVSSGDLVINKMKAWQGSLAISEFDGIVSPAYYVCKTDDSKVDLRFIHHYLRNQAIVLEYEKYSAGMRIGQWDLSIDDFLRIDIALPSVEEQKRIALLIDDKCNQIDTLVANEQAQIEKLKQYKQSLITEVVTKGLDPNAPMKDSGVEWIGVIPKHWHLLRLSDVGDFKKGPFGSAVKKEMFVEKGIDTYKVYEQKNAIYRDATLGYYYLAQENYDKLKDFAIQAGDIIVSCAGTIGESFIVPDDYEKGIINQALMRVRLSSRINSDFFVNAFACIMELETPRYSNGSAMKNIPPFNYLLKFVLPCPPLDEQIKIIVFLNEVCTKLNRMLYIKQSKIEKLTQYKKSLIYEYVTGKKEVCCHDN